MDGELPSFVVDRRSVVTPLEIGLRFAAALVPFWQMRGYPSEGRGHLERLLDAADRQHAAGETESGADLERAAALARLAAGTLTLSCGDPEAARPLIEESLATAQKLGERSLVAVGLLRLGMMARDRGDYPASRAHLEAGLPVQQELGRQLEIAWSLCYLGDIARETDELERASALYREARALLQDMGNRQSVGWLHTRLGRVARREGDMSAALALFEEALTLFRELGYSLGIAAALGLMAEAALQQGDLCRARAQARESLRLYLDLGNPRDLAWSLEIVARIAAAAEAPLPAARWLGSAQAARDARHTPRTPHEQAAHEQTTADLKTRLGESLFQTAHSGGRDTPLAAAVAEALAS
jgi:tetratricopeptide (TPR) repeat protein